MTVAYLPAKEAFWVAVMPYRSKRVIAARVHNGGLDLVLGNLDTKWVNLKEHYPPLSPTVDLSTLRITEGGQTICIGNHTMTVALLLQEAK